MGHVSSLNKITKESQLKMPAVLRDSIQGLYRPDVNSGASSNYGPVSCLGN